MTQNKLKPQDLDLASISEILERRYGQSNLGNKADPLEELVFILLTVKTDHRHYGELWTKFRSRFPTWEVLINASEDDIAEAISFGGLQRQKAKRIAKALREIRERLGEIDLIRLKDMTDEEMERFLLSLDGVGKKIARCVMMYSLGRSVFPVDSNVLRVCQRLGVLDSKVNEEDAHDILQNAVPSSLRYQLHIGLVSLGRDLCTDRAPRCGSCPIRHLCKFSQERSS